MELRIDGVTCTVVHLSQPPLSIDKDSGNEDAFEIEWVSDRPLFWEAHSISRREKEEQSEA